MKLWTTIKENKVTTIAVIACIFLLGLLIFLVVSPPDKTKIYREYLEAENKTLYEEIKVLRARDTLFMRHLQTINDKIDENNGKIQERIYIRDKIIHTIDTMSTSGKQQFFTDRYGQR